MDKLPSALHANDGATEVEEHYTIAFVENETYLSYIAPLASSGVVCRPNSWNADELDDLSKVKRFTTSCIAPDLARLSDFHDFRRLVQKKSKPAEALSSGNNTESAPFQRELGDSGIADDDATKNDENPGGGGYPMPCLISKTGVGMFIEYPVVHVQNVMVQMTLKCSASISQINNDDKTTDDAAVDGDPKQQQQQQQQQQQLEAFHLTEHVLQQLSCGFMYSDYNPRRRLGQLEVRLASPIYSKRIKVRISTRGQITMTNITAVDEIPYAVKEIITAIKSVGAQIVLESSGSGMPLTSEMKRRAVQYLTCCADQVNIRNIRAQMSLPGYVNTIKMQNHYSEQNLFEPMPHDKRPDLELRRLNWDKSYGHNISVVIMPSGTITLMGVRSFDAVELCCRRAYELAFRFLCTLPINTVTRLNDTLSLGPLIHALDVETAVIPPPPTPSPPPVASKKESSIEVDSESTLTSAASSQTTTQVPHNGVMPSKSFRPHHDAPLIPLGANKSQQQQQERMRLESNNNAVVAAGFDSDGDNGGWNCSPTAEQLKSAKNMRQQQYGLLPAAGSSNNTSHTPLPKSSAIDRFNGVLSRYAAKAAPAAAAATPAKPTTAAVVLPAPKSVPDDTVSLLRRINYAVNEMTPSDDSDMDIICEDDDDD